MWADHHPHVLMVTIPIRHTRARLTGFTDPGIFITVSSSVSGRGETGDTRTAGVTSDITLAAMAPAMAIPRRPQAIIPHLPLTAVEDIPQTAAAVILRTAVEVDLQAVVAAVDRQVAEVAVGLRAAVVAAGLQGGELHESWAAILIVLIFLSLYT